MITNDIKYKRAMKDLSDLKAQLIRDFKEAYTEHHKDIQLSAYYRKAGRLELAESYDKLSDSWGQKMTYVHDILAYTFDMSSDEFRTIARDAWKTIITEVPGLTA